MRGETDLQTEYQREVRRRLIVQLGLVPISEDSVQVGGDSDAGARDSPI